MIATAQILPPPVLLFPSPSNVPFQYIETTVPAGTTLAEYRRALPRRITRWQRLKELAGGAR